MKSDKLTQTIELASTIGIKRGQGIIFWDISVELAKQGCVRKAKEIANKVPEDQFKKMILEEIEKITATLE